MLIVLLRYSIYCFKLINMTEFSLVFIGTYIVLFVPLSLWVWDFGGDGSQVCCITVECETLVLQHTVKVFRFVQSNGERLLGICIF